MSVLSLPVAKQLLGRTSNMTAEDAAVLGDLLLGMAQGKVEAYLEYDLEQANHTEYYPQSSYDLDEQTYLNLAGEVVTGSRSVRNLITNHRPVRSIASIYEDVDGRFGEAAGAFAASTLLTPDTHYYLIREEAGISRGGEIVRRNGSWPNVLGSIKVTYSAGYTVAELAANQQAAIRDGLWIQTAYLWSRYQQLKTGMSGAEIGSESIGGGVSVSYARNNLAGLPICDDAAAALADLVSYDDLEL